MARSQSRGLAGATAAPLASVQSREERRQSTIFVALSTVIAVAPLPLGSARPVIWEMMALAIAILLLASLRVSAAEMRPFKTMVAVPVVLFVLVIGFVVVQLGSFVPTDWQNPIWELAEEALPGRVHGSIAVDHQAALVGLLRLLCYGGIFLLSLLLCRSSARAIAALRVVAYSGGCYAAYGLLAYGFGNTTLLWLHKWAYLQDLTGTFVNHNSFATYLGLCFLASLAYLVIVIERARLYGTWRDRLGTIVDLLSRQPAILICIFLVPTALFLTHSRGGFIATLAGCLVLALAMSQAPSLRRLRRLKLAVVPLALVVFAFLISADSLVDRMVGSADNAPGRQEIYKFTWQAIKDYPILGTGLGSFEAVFPIYRTLELNGHVEMAHDDYLQNVLELGFPAAIGLFVALVWLTGVCIRGAIIRRRDAVVPCLGIAASALVAVHSLVDFSLQIPAVTATYVFLLGTAVAQSLSTRPNEPASSGVTAASSLRRRASPAAPSEDSQNRLGGRKT